MSPTPPFATTTTVKTTRPIPIPMTILRVVCDFLVNCFTVATSSKLISRFAPFGLTSVKPKAEISPLVPRRVCLFLGRSSTLVPNHIPVIWLVTLSAPKDAGPKCVSSAKTRTSDTVCLRCSPYTSTKKFRCVSWPHSILHVRR